MKATLVYALTMLKRFLRDPVYLFFTFAFPLVFLFIFGTIFGNNDNINFKIAIISDANNDFATSFVEQFDGDENKTFNVEKDIANLDDAKSKMSRGELDSIIELPAEFGQPGDNQLPSGNLNVYYDEGSPQAGQTIAMVLRSMMDEINSNMTSTQPQFIVNQVSTEQRGLSQFDYTFAGLFAYVLMIMGIYTLSQQLPGEKKTGALRRIQATPFRPWQLLVGLSLVYLLLTAVSAITMVTVSVMLFNFQMRGNWFDLVIFSVVSALAMIGIGAVVAGLARNSNQATLGSQTIAFPMMFLSGVFFPMYLMPEWLQSVSAWIPLTPVGEGVRYITAEGAGLIDVLPQLGLVGAWGLVAYIIAFRVFRWE